MGVIHSINFVSFLDLHNWIEENSLIAIVSVTECMCFNSNNNTEIWNLTLFYTRN